MGYNAFNVKVVEQHRSSKSDKQNAENCTSGSQTLLRASLFAL